MVWAGEAMPEPSHVEGHMATWRMTWLAPVAMLDQISSEEERRPLQELAAC